MNDKEKLIKLKQLGEKYKGATEYYDELIEGDFVLIPPLAQHFVHQIAKQILNIIEE